MPSNHPAKFLNVGLSVSYVGLFKNGLSMTGWHMSLRRFLEDHLEAWVYWNSVYTLFLFITYPTIKLSILALYLRLLSRTHAKARIGVWALIGFLVAVLIGTLAGLLKFCTPVAKLFDQSLPGTCSNTYTLFIVQAVLTVVTDFVVLIPPIPLVWRLNLSMSRRLTVLLPLCLGLGVTGIGIARMQMLIKQLSSAFLIDISWLSTYLAVFEINFALVAICLPALTQLSGRLRKALRSNRTADPATPANPTATEDSKKRPSSITRFVDAPYVELGERATWDKKSGRTTEGGGSSADDADRT
ncbi:MAG: hypothetical protein M1832_002788 [Thelocarpon impressellum]|nr:MAG: hypothetical protein M1832_002788 [Thelocarpon impressellum]